MRGCGDEGGGRVGALYTEGECAVVFWPCLLHVMLPPSFLSTALGA